MSKTQQILCILILAIPFDGLYSQNSLPKFELGINGGIFVYQGDLTPSRFGSIETMRPGINLYGRRFFSSSISIRTQLSISGLRGNDGLYASPAWRQQRNFNFRSPLVELSQLAEWNPISSNYKEKALLPYLFSGVGLSFLNIKRDWSRYNAAYFDENSDLSTRLAEDIDRVPPKLIAVIPAGAGIRYGITPRLAINAEGSYRFLFTDYLDGFSKAANPKRNDHYYSITAGIVYRFGIINRLDCPTPKY